jgi:hypothetical protein
MASKKGRRRKRTVPRNYERKCETGKVGYRDQAQAESELTYIQALHRNSQYVPSRTYQCDLCGDWHLTKKDLR